MPWEYIEIGERFQAEVWKLLVWSTSSRNRAGSSRVSAAVDGREEAPARLYIKRGCGGWTDALCAHCNQLLTRFIKKNQLRFTKKNQLQTPLFSGVVRMPWFANKGSIATETKQLFMTWPRICRPDRFVYVPLTRWKPCFGARQDLPNCGRVNSE
jgi:hypothetical protein